MKSAIYVTGKGLPKKIKAMITIDLKAFKEPTQLNVYVPNKYEKNGGAKEPIMYNDIQDKYIALQKVWDDGFDCVVCCFNDTDFRHNLTVWITEKNHPYLELDDIEK